MSQLKSADEVIEIIKSGKYATKTNAQRGAGRTRLSKGEKDKVFAFIESHFGADGETPTRKVAKKTAKKAAKKVSKKVTATASPKKVAKKIGKRSRPVEVTQADQSGPPGTLPISPSEVSSVADILKVIDSTVNRSSSIMGALAKVKELNPQEDVSEGVGQVKRALTGAAQVLNNSVIAPLSQIGGRADPEVTARLEQVVAAAAPPVANHAPAETQASPPPYIPPPLPSS